MTAPATLTAAMFDAATPRRSASQSASWPAPLRPAAYHGLMGEIVQAVGPETEADPAGILTTLLIMVGNVIGRTCYFEVSGGRHHLNLYLGIVGKTAKGRKGVGLDVARALLRDVDPEWSARCQASGLSTGEGLIHSVRDEVIQQKPQKERGVVIGYEPVVVDPGVPDKRLLVVETELASVLKRMGRDGNTLSAQLRDGWDGRNLRSMTKGAPECATEPHISLVAHITAAELRRYLDATEQANGLANRVLWCCVQRQQVLPDGGALPIDPTWHTRLGEILEWCRVYGGGELTRDAEASSLWHDVYRRWLSRDRPGLFGAVIGRAEALVMRLACLYAVCDRTTTITAAHLRAALAVWRYCEASAAYLFGDSTGDPIADDLLLHLRAAYPESLTRTEIAQAFGRNRSAGEITRAITMLVEASMAASEMDRRGTGRPVERVWFTPQDEIDEENELTPNPSENRGFSAAHGRAGIRNNPRGRGGG